VRVIRGHAHPSPHSPPVGYSYDGLYVVEDYWHEPGRSGVRVWRYRLRKVPQEATPDQTVAETPAAYSVVERRETTISRIVRDTAQARRIKALYRYACQVCDLRLEGLAGPYAEAAHIRPLGRPHNGPDTADNILCLCPNHHVLLDFGGLHVNEDFSIVGEAGRLTLHPRHRINPAYLLYRLTHYRP
jgi:putative restriction endonuclease